MDAKKAVENLKRLVNAYYSDNPTGKHTTKRFAEWSRINNALLAELFNYTKNEGMPEISSLVGASFHDQLPLVMFNYTKVAHFSLHEHVEGWTDELRLCRGIVFDSEGNLVALPFPKFFNFGEHPETLNIPRGPWEVTVKFDGHLGILFWYNGQLVITTRGRFDSPSAVLATAMVQELIKAGHKITNLPKDMTALVEIIHPDTHVLVDYDKEEKFVLIGMTSLETLTFCNIHGLQYFADQLGIECTKLHSKDEYDIAQFDPIRLKLEVEDRAICNIEGYVVHFPSTGHVDACGRQSSGVTRCFAFYPTHYRRWLDQRSECPL